MACNTVTPLTRTSATMHRRIVMPRLLMGVLLISPWNLAQQPMTRKHKNQRGYKDYPTREFVKKAFDHFVPEMICQQASTHYSDRVADDRDRNHQERKHPAQPPPILHQIAVSHRQRDQRHERSDPAARLNNLQRVIRQNDQITLAEHGHVHQLQPKRGEPG